MVSLTTVSLLRRLRRSESGAEVIEFALTLPLLLLVVFGIIEFGFVFQQYEVVTNAAREGARMASLSTYGTTPAVRRTNAMARVNQYIAAAGLDTSSSVLTVCVGPGNNDTVCDGTISQSPLPGGTTCVWTTRVKVEYAHPVTFVGGIIRYFGGSWPGTLTLRARSTMRTEAQAALCP